MLGRGVTFQGSGTFIDDKLSKTTILPESPTN